METIKTPSRIHPLMAAAAVSVIVVSLAGTAAITGLLPSSKGAQDAALNTAQATAPAAAQYGTPQAMAAMPGVPATYATQPQQVVQAGYVQPMQVAQAVPVAQVQPAPVVIEKTVIKEVPAKPVRHVQHHTQYARADAPAYYAPAPAPAQPNYVAIGTGAVVGGLLGNQVGSGNGRKLATIAGLIGGGYVGNQIANQNR